MLPSLYMDAMDDNHPNNNNPKQRLKKNRLDFL